MHRWFGRSIGILIAVVLFVFARPVAASPSGSASFSNLRKTLASIKSPRIEQPEWLKQQLVAEASKNIGTSTNIVGRVFTYTVATRGAIYADFNEFQTLANQTLNDSRGWARMGISFKQVSSSGNFTIVLAQSSQMPMFSSGCSAEWSCTAGNYVAINQDRWMNASAPWNAAKKSLRDYRNLVINHEVGHWLGHGDTNCNGIGQSAPVMQQQSIDLEGCVFNSWPLASELWVTR